MSWVPLTWRQEEDLLAAPAATLSLSLSLRCYKAATRHRASYLGFGNAYITVLVLARGGVKSSWRGRLGGVQDDAVRDEHSGRGGSKEGEQDKDPTLLAHALSRLPGHAGRRPSTSILASSTPIHRGTGHWTQSDVRGVVVPRELP